ncbi:hypothetical protein EMPS_07014 [Entomortierella parvispora]|uniref:Tc1-like transposase DDE domain-containing protein n=1 Tax=Entomortierella parvispora TaxID=205924 RepID=A0A9P3HDL4_9FUNG|nr:hypothetical protein EMPS_07014 [Entomortierella parvispora]
MIIGRPKLVISESLSVAIRTFILENNRAGIPVTKSLILEELQKNQKLSIPGRTLSRYLFHLGLVYGKNKHQRNIYQDKPANAEHRHFYLEQRLENLNAKGHPILPEVFLDETHCYLDPQTMRSIEGAAVDETGRKPMVLLFGAFVVYHNGFKMKGEIVKKSILIWPVGGQAHGQDFEDENWSSVPAFVQGSGVAPDSHDYQGPFTSNLFERIFKEICKTLSDEYGPCHIHMDSAKYHFGRKNPLPRQSAPLDQLVQWFKDNGHPLPTRSDGRAMTRLGLLDWIDHMNIAPVYASYDIANKHGHTIMRTPPHHCELQPIENLWGLVKNPIALDPNLNETCLSLRNRLLEGFAKVKSEQLVSFWEKTVKIGKDYWEQYEEDLEMSQETDDEVSDRGEDEDMFCSDDDD